MYLGETTLSHGRLWRQIIQMALKTKETRRVCETWMPRRQQSQNMAKISVLHFDPAPSKGHVISVKCEEPINELTVQVWLLYDQPNFKYCTL